MLSYKIKGDSKDLPKHIDMNIDIFTAVDFDKLLKQSRKDLEEKYQQKEELWWNYFFNYAISIIKKICFNFLVVFRKFTQN